MVGGTGRFDTRVMERLGERVFCKVGAEGVFCAALPERGLGVAIKVDDGNNARAAEVAMAAAIEAFVALDDGEARVLRSLSDVTLRNWNGIEVGALRATRGAARGWLAIAVGPLSGLRRRHAAVMQRQQRLERRPACRPRAAACRRGCAACAESAPRCRSCGGCCG